MSETLVEKLQERTGQIGGSLAAAVSDRAVAEIKAAITVARMYPRDRDAALVEILKDCERPMLAEQAMYVYARGGTEITGPSIRLLEAIGIRWGNLETGVSEISRDNGVSECVAYAWDMETTRREKKEFPVRHWRDTRKGGYRVTDERDIYELIANMGARRKRACMQAVIPADIIDLAVEKCEQVLMRIAVTPQIVQGIIDTFAKIGVTRALLEKRCQRSLDSIKPSQVISLRKIIMSIKDGMSKPGDWFDMPQSNQDTASGRAYVPDTAAHDDSAAPPVKPAEPETKSEPRRPEAPDPAGQSPAAGTELSGKSGKLGQEAPPEGPRNWMDEIAALPTDQSVLDWWKETATVRQGLPKDIREAITRMVGAHRGDLATALKAQTAAPIAQAAASEKRATDPLPPGARSSPTEWPELGKDNLWRDSTGAAYEPDRHGWNAVEKRPSVTQTGTFRIKRGQAQQQDASRPEAAAQETGPAIRPDLGAPTDLSGAKSASTFGMTGAYEEEDAW